MNDAEDAAHELLQVLRHLRGLVLRTEELSGEMLLELGVLAECRTLRDEESELMEAIEALLVKTDAYRRAKGFGWNPQSKPSPMRKA